MKSARWGTKSHAAKAVLHQMRQFAAAQRDQRNRGLRAEHEYTLTHGKALGAISALFEVGAISRNQHERCYERLLRIIKAKVARRPFGELRRVA